MPLHPQAERFLEAFNKQFSVDFETVEVTAFREAFRLVAPSRLRDAVASIEDRAIPSPAGPLRLRIYTPASTGPWPMTLYFYGGGFTIGQPEQADGICRALARRANSLVVSPDYRLAPEAKFPAATEDAKAALKWLQDHGAEIGGDPARLAVAGDSSGGNFAAMLAQHARMENIPLRHQLLLYPALDARADTPSYRSMANGYGLTADWMRWYWRQYLPTPEAGLAPRASPALSSDLSALAPATIVTAEYDILRDEAETYAANLEAAGTSVLLKRWPGQIHGFLLLQDQFDDAEPALDYASAALHTAFAV